MPATTPGSNAWQPASAGASNPIPPLGMNDAAAKPPRTKLFLSIMIPTTVVIVAGLLTYFWFVPSSKANSYLTKVKPAYNAQTDKMKAVYDSFSSPTFTSNTTSPETDAATFAQANVAIKLATTATSTLASDNAFSPPPGTTSFGSAKKAQQQYKAMKAYVQDSRTFLQDYQQLVTYASSLEQLTEQQGPAVVSALDKAGGSRTLTELRANCQQASDLLTTMINAMTALHPPSDLNDYQSTSLKDLNDANDALKGVVAAIANGDPGALVNAAAELEQAGTTLSNYNPNVSNMLQTNSAIHTLLVKLQGEKPLTP